MDFPNKTAALKNRQKLIRKVSISNKNIQFIINRKTPKKMSQIHRKTLQNMLIIPTSARSSETYFKPKQKRMRKPRYGRVQKLNVINFQRNVIQMNRL